MGNSKQLKKVGEVHSDWNQHRIAQLQSLEHDTKSNSLEFDLFPITKTEKRHASNFPATNPNDQSWS